MHEMDAPAHHDVDANSHHDGGHDALDRLLDLLSAELAGQIRTQALRARDPELDGSFQIGISVTIER